MPARFEELSSFSVSFEKFRLFYSHFLFVLKSYFETDKQTRTREIYGNNTRKNNFLHRIISVYPQYVVSLNSSYAKCADVSQAWILAVILRNIEHYDDCMYYIILSETKHEL